MNKSILHTITKQHFLYLFIFILFSHTIYSQNLSVASFRKLDNSMTARIDAPKKDQNGDYCAVIKIVTTQTGFTFEGDGAGIYATEHKTAEYWIWVGYGAKRLTVKHPQLGILRDYSYTIPIEKATDYELVLATGKIVTTLIEEIESKWLLITATPDNSIIYINNVFAGTGTAQKKLKPGKYEYRIEAPYYHSTVGKIQMNNDNVTQTIKLLPAFGFIQINSLPEDGATIMIDEKQINNITPFRTDTLVSGEHLITITKQMFQPNSQQVLVKDNQTTPLTLSMQPNFAEVEISAPSDASIWIDNINKGTAIWKGRLDAGIYTIEARKEKYTTHKKDIEIKAGEKLNFVLTPIPKYGKLDIVTQPPLATITINEKNYGTIPTTIKDLLIGDYKLTVSLEGHETKTITITINENKTTEISETLASAKEVTIISTPTYADLTIDGKYIGITPQKLVLSFGEHLINLTYKNRVLNKKIKFESNTENLLALDIPPKIPLFSYKQFMEKGLQWDIIKAGYALSNGLKFQTADINPTYNFQLASRINYFPLMLEAGYSMVKYNNQSLSNNINRITYSGFILDVCVQPLPYLGKVSYHIRPYIGVGIFIGGLNAQDDENNQISYLNTTAAFWKLGLQCFPLKNNIFIECDYEKSLSTTVENKFNKFTISAGYSIKL